MKKIISFALAGLLLAAAYPSDHGYDALSVRAAENDTALELPFASLIPAVNSKKGAPVLTEFADFDVIDTTKMYSYDGHTYCIYNTTDANWLEAHDYCQRLGGELVSISSEEEQNFIESIVSDRVAADPECGNMFIGAFKWEGHWVWIDDVNQTDLVFADYKNWDATQPDNYFGRDYGSAIITHTEDFDTWGTEFGKWDDIDHFCKDGTYFICEWDFDYEKETVTMLTENDKSQAVSFGSSRYLAVPSVGGWYVTEYYCQKNGGHLASITSEEEQNVLEAYAAEISEKDPGILTGSIGAYCNLSDPGTWYWTDGSEFGSYSNWYEDMPDFWGDIEHLAAFSIAEKPGTLFYYDGKRYESHRGAWNDQIGGNAVFFFEWDSSFAVKNQPSDITASEGTTAKFTVTAGGTGLKYQWYWRKNANEAWAASTGTGCNSSSLSVAAELKRNGYQYFCKITNSDGLSINTNAVTLTVKSALAVTSQPVNKTVTEGSNAKFAVAANGTGLKYQWYWRKNSSGTWAASSGTGYNTNTLTVAGETKRNGYQYYCKITDASGNTVKTNTVTLTVKSALAVTAQPVSKTVTEGTAVKFTVTASGTGLKYQWYWRKPSDINWTASTGTGYNTNTLSVAGETKRNGYQYYCVITDASGNKVTTDAVTLTVKSALAVTAQPVNKTVTEGTTAKFTVTASGTGLKYQWYWRKPSDIKWTASTGTGYNTNTLSVAGETKRNGYQYYCVITDASGNKVTTDAVTLTVKEALKITEQPSDIISTPGDTARFTVTAGGTGLKYQWYWRKNSEGTWSACTGTGYNTGTLSVAATEARNGYQYYCKITDASGNTVKTNTVTLTVKFMITMQPESRTANEGGTVNFIAVSNSIDPSYQWYYRSSSSGTWTKCTESGASTAVLVVSAAKSKNGYEYRCVITDGNTGRNLTTSAAKLTVK